MRAVGQRVEEQQQRRQQRQSSGKIKVVRAALSTSLFEPDDD